MSDILEPNFSGLPKPTDWKKVIVPLQQANEKEFRGATLPELADEMLKDKTINGQRMKAVPPGALPAGPSDKEMYMELLSEGTWTWNGVAVVTNTKGSISNAWWNKETWSKDDGVELPSTEVADNFNNRSVNIALSSNQGAVLANDIGLNQIFIEKDILTINGTETLVGTSRTKVLNYKALSNSKSIKINVVVSGLFSLCTFSINKENNTIVRTQQFSRTLDVGVHEIEDITVLKGEYFGWVINNTNLNGRIGFKSENNNDYGFYNYAGSITTTPVTLPAESRNARYAVSIENQNTEGILPRLTEIEEQVTDNFNKVDFDKLSKVFTTTNAVTIIFSESLKGKKILGGLILKGSQTGKIAIGLYRINGTIASRIKADELALIQDVTKEYKTELFDDIPSDEDLYFGFSWNGNSALGRIAYEDLLGKGYYQIPVNVTAGSTVGVLKTDRNFAFTFKTYNKDSFISDLKSSVLINKVQLSVPDLTYIQQSKLGATRNDNSSMIRLSDRSLICAWATFISGTGDHNTAFIKLKKSYDNGVTWVDFLDIPNSSIGHYVPSLHLKNNGEILLMYLVKTATTPRGYIAYRISSDECQTWGEQINVVNNIDSLNYYVMGADRIYKANNGNLYYPYSILISGNGNSTTSVYHGKLLKSIDDGVTWVDTGKVFEESTENVIVETGVYQDINSNIIYYSRSRTGYVRYSSSNDNAVTWTSLSNLLPAPNSMSVIKKLNNFNTWVAFVNNMVGNGEGNASRTKLELYVSNDGISFTLKKTIRIFDNLQYVFEPTLFEDRLTHGIYVSYCLTDTVNYDLFLQRVNYDSIFS